MRIAIIDHLASGHHLVHVRHIVAEAASRQWEVDFLTTPNVVEAQYLAEHSATFLKATIHAVAPGPFVGSNGVVNVARAAATTWIWWKTLYWSHLRCIQPDFIYVVNLDYSDKLLAVIGSPFGHLLFGGMLMGVTFHHKDLGIAAADSRRQSAKRSIFQRLLRISTLKALLVIDELLPDYTESRQTDGREVIRYVPDIGGLAPLENLRDNRSHLGLRSSDCVLLVYGALARGKGLDVALRAVADGRCPSHVSLLVVGVQDNWARQIMASGPARQLRTHSRLVEVPRFVTEEEESECFHSADVVWVGYQGFGGSSGVLLQAAMAGRPVLACNEGLIGWRTITHKLGVVADIGNPENVISALRLLVEDVQARATFGANGSTYARRHTAKEFARNVCEAISAAVQQPVTAPQAPSSILWGRRSRG